MWLESFDAIPSPDNPKKAYPATLTADHGAGYKATSKGTMVLS